MYQESGDRNNGNRLANQAIQAVSQAHSHANIHTASSDWSSQQWHTEGEQWFRSVNNQANSIQSFALLHLGGAASV